MDMEATAMMVAVCADTLNRFCISPAAAPVNPLVFEMPATAALRVPAVMVVAVLSALAKSSCIVCHPGGAVKLDDASPSAISPTNKWKPLTLADPQ